jgi:hypothetical protein
MYLQDLEAQVVEFLGAENLRRSIPQIPDRLTADDLWSTGAPAGMPHLPSG